MNGARNFLDLEAAIGSTDGVSACVVTEETVGSARVLVAHIATERGARVPALRATLDGTGLPLPRHVACWDDLSDGAGGLRRDGLGGEPLADGCVGFGLDDEGKRAVARLWADVLQPAALGTGDSFMDLGGHSLLAIRMLHALGKETGTRVPVYEFLDDPTVAGLARLLALRAGASTSIGSGTRPT